MGNAFNLGKLFGIQFRLHYTWFIVFILVVVSLSTRYFPLTYSGWSDLVYWATGIITSLLFFTSVLAHELAHSLVAKANDIPVKSITLFIFGGIAQITREAPKASTELIMAAAGPACSLVIGGLFALLWLFTQNAPQPVPAMALWLAYVNGILAVFNLIPGFPLDGGRVFRSLLWRITGNYRRSTLIATQVGRGVGYLFILGGILVMVFLYDWFSGLWLVFIGWFLENAASASYRQTRRHLELLGITASQVMTSDLPTIPSNITVNQLIQDNALTDTRQLFMVADEGEFKGILTLHNVKSVSRVNWDTTQVKEIMTPAGELKATRPDQEAIGILEQMIENNINQMPVVKEGRVIGLVTRDNLLGFLRTRS
jgi:Zn-dependent protease